MRTYEKYKDSGIEWIGEIPESWKFVSLRRITLDHKQGYYLPEGYIESGCKLIRISDLSVNGKINYETAPSTNITNQDYEIFNLQIGDFLFPRTGSIGLLGYVEEDIYAVFASYLIRFRFSTLVEPQFLKFYFVSVSFIEGIFSELHGGVNQNIHAENIKNQFIPVPPLSVQTAIANYLDSKTSEIDQLIADKEALVSLYEEEKKVLINGAVTKGLNPEVKLKPSGIDWLGDVPEHWEVKKLKYVAVNSPSNVDKKSNEDEKQVLLCNYVDVYKNDFITSDLRFMEATASNAQIENFKLQKGDVLVTKDSETPEDIAIPALVKDDFENVICGYHLTQIRSNNEFLIGEFLFRLFQLDLYRQYFSTLARGVTRYGLTTSSFSEMPIILPPLAEQTSIFQYIESETANINDKINQIKQEIALLKEYRQALIFEAVTGKIRVD